MLSVDKYSSNPLGAFTGLWKHRALVWQMARREVISKYRGSFLGLLWSFFNPVFMLAVYTFVFGVVFQIRWAGQAGGKAEFALVLFSGLIIHSLFSECINRAPGLIVSNPNYVKKVVFPLDILPWVAMGSAFFHAMVSVVVWLIFFIIVHHYLNWTAVFFPLLLFPFVLLTMGVSWFLASIGVYLRDISQITGVVTATLLFLSPIFYPIAAVPEQYRPLLFLNPLTFIVEQTRAVLIWGQPPDWPGLAIYAVAGFVIAAAGWVWFNKTRRGFADVL